MNTFREYINNEKVVIGMIHVPALPGTPNNKLSPKEIITIATTEARVYKKMGLSAIMIENMHDVPYTNSNVGHEISSLMAIIGYEIKKQTGLFCGVQILAAANKEALASAQSAGMDFIRAEGFVFGHLADEGVY
jgi:predicted TIM-barrel enzyme